MLERVLGWYGSATYTDDEFTWAIQANSIGSTYAYTLTMTNKRTKKSIKRKFYTFAGVEAAMLQYGATVVEGWHL